MSLSDTKPPALPLHRHSSSGSCVNGGGGGGYVSGSKRKASEDAGHHRVSPSVSPPPSSSLGLRIVGLDARGKQIVDIGSESKASGGASHSVPGTVSSSSSSLSTGGSDSGGSSKFLDEDLSLDSDYDSDCQSDSGSSKYHDEELGLDSDDGSTRETGGLRIVGLDARGKQIVDIADRLPYNGLMMLLFETPSGFALFTFPGVYCYLDDSVDTVWAEFGDPLRTKWIIYPKGFISLEDKSSAITDAAVDKKLLDLINKWHKPGMKLCVGKPEYKRIIESVLLGIDCMYCETVMEIMWGLQQQMHYFVPREKSKLTKEDRLPMSRGLKKFLINYGYDDDKPEMVNEKIFVTACSLFRCDVDDNKNLRFLRKVIPYIRHISGIACENWDVLKLAIAVKVICSPQEELTDFHEVLPDDVLSKLKGDAHKYKAVPVKSIFLRPSKEVTYNHHLRIKKKNLLESLLREAKKAYEAKQVEAKECENVKLVGESEQIAQGHVTFVSTLSTPLIVELVRRSPRLHPKLIVLGIGLALALALVMIRGSYTLFLATRPS